MLFLLVNARFGVGGREQLHFIVLEAKLERINGLNGQKGIWLITGIGVPDWFFDCMDTENTILARK